MKILVADDSMVSRHLLVATLRKWGYDVVDVANGTDAWKVLSEDDAPSMAVLDWVMPGMTGPDVCQLVRKQGRENYTYVLLLTSRGNKEDIVAGMESGADDYVVKPFEHSELQVRLRAGKRIVELQRELLAAREALRDQATRDALTRLWNRGTILAALQRELARGSREGEPLSLAIMDLDHFKVVNDTFGHLAGDEVLREAARRMNGAVRSYDGVGRYGGEEFLILLPGCDGASALEQAERLRQLICAEPVVIGELVHTVTASFGVTSVVPGPSTSSEQMIDRADQALYLAKSRGRNRVEFFQAKTETTSPTALLSH